MEDRKELAKIRAKLRLDMLANFKDAPVIEINQIPKDWTIFSENINDYWKEVESDDRNNKTSCFYELDANGIFPTHRHKHQKETVTLLTPNSKVEFITEDGIFFYEYPSTFSVERGVSHALVNEQNKKVLLKVDWTPKMIGFEVEFE